MVDASCPNNTIRPRELEALIVRLLKGGYRFRTFTDAASDPGPRDVVLTFDDGYVDNYVELLPILRRQNVPATCFVTSRFDDPRFLSREQLREMDASGLVEIGGHTSGHCVLTSVDIAEAREQIRANKRDLEAALGHPIASFAYPCGGENDDIVSEVVAAGYRFAAAMVKKMRPVEDVTTIPMMGLMMYSRSDTATYGVFRVDPYVKGDYEAPFDYKVTLTPVGKSAEIFLDEDFYTTDLRDTPAEMVFNDSSLAEKFMNMLAN